MEAALKAPLSERINFRMIGFCLIMATLVGYPLYVYLDSVVSGGIKDRGDYLEVDLKAMSTFPFDQVKGTVNDVPEKWRALDGKKVMLTGEMWDTFSLDNNVTNFQLVYSIANCCLSGSPQIQHFIQAKAVPGKKIIYREGLVKVLGTLRVDVKREAGKVTQVYALDVESVEPA